MYVTGIGYYELRVNGEKTGDRVLEPTRTNYDERIFYNAFDITDRLHYGGNALGIMLGQGWYLHSPRAILQLNIEYSDGTHESVYSDESWKSHTGPMCRNTVFGGETYDARCDRAGWDMPGFDDSGWKNAALPGCPGGASGFADGDSDKNYKNDEAGEDYSAEEGCLGIDFGQNLTGWIQIAVQGPHDTKITMEYAENLYPEGTVNDENYRSAVVRDVYFMKGEGVEEYEPRFTYHGFRYVQITGLRKNRI